MVLVTYLPSKDDDLHEQKSASSVSDEEFMNNLVPEKCTTTDRFIQVFQFILFFGWLRLLLFIPVTLIYFTLLVPFVVSCKLNFMKETLYNFSKRLSQVFFHVVFLLMGAVKINVKGKIDKEARAQLYNHQSYLDGPLLFMIDPFLIVCMAELKKVPFVGTLLAGGDSIFIDRSKKCGTAGQIVEVMKDKKRMHLAIAPEGKTTRGHYMLKFHTGGFLSDEPVQPVTIRYKHYLGFGKTGYTCIVGSFYEWIWRVFCCPFTVIDVNFLPTLEGEKYLKKTPEERALMCQLAIANDLGVLASDRSNREYEKIIHENPTKEFAA